MVKCLYCNTEFEKKAHNQKYPSKGWLIKDWRKKNPKKFKNDQENFDKRHPNYKKEHFKKNYKKYKLRKKQRREEIKNTEEYKEKNKEYSRLNRKRNLEKINKYNKEYGKKFPERVKAQQKATRKIKIPFGQLCEECRINPAREKHHPDYSKPLEIKFLCNPCHKRIHRRS